MWIANLQRRWRIVLALLVIYSPFGALLLCGDGLDNWRTLYKLSPILPSIAIHALTGILNCQRWELTALLTLIWFAGVIAGFMKLQRAFLPFAGATLIVSSAFVWVVLQLLRA